ncbi:hypothetical protein [Mesorhizobium sp. SP-1A]|uniref:hypothetical protein n=1 Tax=Mesorhizobium sp. SP-1A TaxID=3077840 RepID=UPI0028F6CA82|nr:hypothetical protein [Mesorhizobium sp. SP-1A]
MKLSVTDVTLRDRYVKHKQALDGQVTFSDEKSYEFHISHGGIRFYFFPERYGNNFAQGFFSREREILLKDWLRQNGKDILLRK